MKVHIKYFVILLALFLAGCATASRQSKTDDVRKVLNTSEEENMYDAATALESVSEAITGKNMSEDELKALAHDLKTNEETQSAVKKIADTLEGKNVSVKYCPTTGERFSSDMEYCPGTKIKLLPVE